MKRLKRQKGTERERETERAEKIESSERTNQKRRQKTHFLIHLSLLRSGFVEKEHRNVEQPMTALRSIENSDKIWAAAADSVIYLYSKH